MNDHAGGTASRRVFVYNGGFLLQRRLRRILSLAGYQIRLGRPGKEDAIAIWGNSPTAHRGIHMAQKYDCPLVRVEDAFLRSLHPGRDGEPPLGLLIDHSGMHFDAAQPSDLEVMLKTHPLDDTALLDRARSCMAQLQEHHLSKYSATDLNAPLPDPGYVLVVDQVRDDASVRASQGDRARFLEMLFVAREEHPGKRIVIKAHPESSAGHRPGYYQDSDATDGVILYDSNPSPWALLEGAVAVYTLSSQMGFEAILAGHKPRVFGTPFYAGWGLTQDEAFLPKRQRMLTRAQLFAASMILYPKWYDPYHNRLCQLEDVINTLAARTRAWREDHRGWVAQGMRLWKRRPLQQFFGQSRRLVFEEDPAKAWDLAQNLNRPLMGWANRAAKGAVRVEDGFLRSRGLGADLIPPLSLVTDRQGIYYNPNIPSDLEDWIIHRAKALRPDQIQRAERVLDRILDAGLSKYNLSTDLPTLPEGRRILVSGQVEDDASILLGCGEVNRNLDLLRLTREHNPDATILWKPHPDVVAGLRKGQIDAPLDHADMEIEHGDIAQLLTQVDEVWTLTSLTGFEALLRGKSVTTLGAPFYAGWGLTRDLGAVPQRRLTGPRPSLAALAHAVLIDYPRYFDPVTQQPCPIEVVIDRLAHGPLPRPGAGNRLLAKLQGLLASQAHLWRR
jgi:capsular polysaccharide export protein